MIVLETIKNYWVLITFIIGCLGTFFSFTYYMIQAVKCSLRNDVLTIYDRAVDRGKKITRYELEAISHSAEIYFKLKGNSFVQSIVKDVEKFEKID